MTAPSFPPSPPAEAAAMSADPGFPSGVGTGPAVDPGVPLRQRTAMGFVWVVITVASNKLIGFAAQLVLARLLTREDFGLISLTLAASVFALLLRESGVTQVLVQRGNRFDELAGPAFGLITVLSTTAGVVLAALSHPLSRWFGDARVVPMLYVVALNCPLAGLGNVAVARLEHELRFRELGLIATVVTVVQYASQTLLALAGAGAMSFVWGLLISTAVRLAWLWWLCLPQTRGYFNVAAWAGLLGDSVWVLGVSLLGAVASQFDRLVLGRVVDLSTVGLYFFAANLTTQATQLLSNTLAGVLFPALSRLADRPERQREVFIELARQLSFVGVPLCVFQAAMARPIVAVFGHQWDGAVRLMQILSVATALTVCGAPANALFQSQGRFRGFLFAQAFYTFFNCLFVTAAAYFGSSNPATAIALAVGVYYCIFGPLGVQLALGRWRLPWPESWQIFVPGVVLATVGTLATVPAVLAFADGPVKWAAVAVSYAAAVACGMRLLFPSDWTRLRTVLDSLRRKRAAA